MSAAASAVVTSSTPLWYATRATGVVSLILLTGSVVLGVITSVRHASERWPRLVTLGVHRNLSLLVTVFLALHILTAELDTFAPVGLLALAVPFLSAYRAIWLGLGTVASDLLVAITLTSLLRARIGHRVWRLVHWMSYACWPLAVVHGLGTGTDAGQPVILALTVLCVVGVLTTVAWRLADGWPRDSGIRLAAGTLSAVALVAGIGWSVAGPLKAGWSARAGTPGRSASAAVNPAGAAITLALPLSTSVSGTINTTGNGGTQDVTINGTGAAVAFHIVISGPPAAGGGVRMTASQADFGPTGQPDLYTGHVTALSGTTIRAALSDQAGATAALTLNLAIEGSNVSGTLAAAAGSGG
jgi:hypothetical protein